MKKQKKAVRRRAPKPRMDAKMVEIAHRVDGWRSALSGLGTVKDKRQWSTFKAEATNWVENLELWRGDDLAGRIVETIPNEMMRQGWELCIEGPDGKDIQSDVVGLLEDLNVDDKLWQALCAERALGGAAILIGVNDLKELEHPLDIEKANNLTFLETFEPSELKVERWQNDPAQKGFGRPVMYRLNPVSPGGAKNYGVKIHESRLLIFPGIRVSRRQITTQSGWGDAVLTRCRDTLRDFQTTWAAAGLLTADFAQAVWKIKGLAEIIALDKDKELQNRITAMEMARSIVRATVIDADGEEFDRKQTPVTGLPELLDRFATRLAAAADIPVTLLMGMAPAGLNATGESDIRTFYDRVASMQRRKLRPTLEKLIRVAFASLEYDEPDDWSIKFHPLWQPTEGEQAAARKTQMEIDTSYMEHSVLSPDEVRKQRFGGREYSFQTHVEGELEPPPPAVTPEYEQMAEEAGQEADQKIPPDDSDEETLPEKKPAKTVRQDEIKKKGRMWEVWSKDGKKKLGSFNSKAAAEKRLAQIEFFSNGVH